MNAVATSVASLIPAGNTNRAPEVRKEARAEAEAIGKACIKDLRELEKKQDTVNQWGAKHVMPHFHRLANLAVKEAGNKMAGAQAYFIMLCGFAEQSILRESKDLLLSPDYGYTEKTLKDAKVSVLFPSWNTYKTQVKASFAAFGSGDNTLPAIDPTGEDDPVEWAQQVRDHYNERPRGARAGNGNTSTNGVQWPETFKVEMGVFTAGIAKLTAEGLEELVPHLKKLNAIIAGMLEPTAKTDASKGTTGPGAARNAERDAPARNAA